MPIPKFDWYSFGDELRNTAANIYVNQQEQKRLKALAKQQAEEFDLKKSQADANIKAQANADAIATMKAKYPERFNLPVKQQIEYLTPKEVNVVSKYPDLPGKKPAGQSMSWAVSMLNDADSKLLAIKNTLADTYKINKDNNYQKTSDLINQMENTATEYNLEAVYNKAYGDLPKVTGEDFKTFVNYLINAKYAMEKRFFAKRQLSMPGTGGEEAIPEAAPEAGGEATDPALDYIMNKYQQEP